MTRFQSTARVRAHRGVRAAIIVLCAIVVTSAGCRHRRPDPPRPGNARLVVIDKGHRHTDRCGHYERRGRWYYNKGHIHRHECGHLFVGGIWISR